MAYNGRIPGPEIRVREGERLRVTLKNSLREPTTIHWHGLDVPNAMDGVPGLTPPRRAFVVHDERVYEITLSPFGDEAFAEPPAEAEEAWRLVTASLKFIRSP